MATNPADKYRHNAILEGGKSGSGGSSTLETVSKVGGPAAITFIGGAGGSQIIKNAREKREQAESEAADEMKRETRGVQKTATDLARDDAREMKMLEQADKASRAASRDMGMKKGGTASSRADGIAQRGKTRGTIVMCGGGYMKAKK
jgi:hypothetical protein